MPIIADKAHLFKIVDVQQDLREVLVEIFSFCSETSVTISIGIPLKKVILYQSLENAIADPAT